MASLGDRWRHLSQTVGNAVAHRAALFLLEAERTAARHRDRMVLHLAAVLGFGLAVVFAAFAAILACPSELRAVATAGISLALAALAWALHWRARRRIGPSFAASRAVLAADLEMLRDVFGPTSRQGETPPSQARTSHDTRSCAQRDPTDL